MSRQVLLFHQKLKCSPPATIHALELSGESPASKVIDMESSVQISIHFYSMGSRTTKWWNSVQDRIFICNTLQQHSQCHIQCHKFCTRGLLTVSNSSYKSGKFVHVHTMTAYRRSRGIAAFIWNLSNRQRWAARLTPWTLLYPEINPSANRIWDVSDYTVFSNTLWNERVMA
jgi:hypothetical protein